MPKTPNYSRYACDRKQCGTVEYLQDSDPKAATWKTVKRITADGVTTECTLCPMCYPKYKMVAESADKAYNAYMEGDDK